MLEIKTRKCNKCNGIKPFELFRKNKKCEYGITWECLECRNKRRRKPVIVNKLETKGLRRCKKCETIKTFDMFVKNSKHKHGIRYLCKKCHNEYNMEYLKANKNIKNKKNEADRNYRENNKEKIKKYRQDNKNKMKEYYSREEVRKHINKYNRERINKNINAKLASNLRNRFKHALKSKSVRKTNKSLDLIGCSINELKNYLELLFIDGMSWDNYGYYGWHIDHIKPVKSFDLTKKEERKECFNYNNLQPLWAKDNLSKGSKLEWVKP